MRKLVTDIDVLIPFINNLKGSLGLDAQRHNWEQDLASVKHNFWDRSEALEVHGYVWLCLAIKEKINGSFIVLRNAWVEADG
jgi:hypothetical protein